MSVTPLQAKMAKQEADREVLENVRSELYSNLPGAVQEYCHEKALEAAYGGNFELYTADSEEVGGEPQWSSLPACRQYLYYEVYTNTLRTVAG